MGKVKVKICGITNLPDAEAAINAGCDALGFVFFKKSPRYIDPGKAKEIIQYLPKQIVKIGVFVDAKEEMIKKIAKACKLDILQFHGSESADFCEKFKNYKIIKAFRIKNKINQDDISRYHPFAFLFDTYLKSKAGGTGKSFDWKLISYLKGINKQIFLSGGLNEKNVKEAIKVARPDWVDVSSSVESIPGKKDHKKLKRFIEVAKSVGKSSNL